MDQPTKDKPVITPELMDSIFTEEVLSILPADKNVKYGIEQHRRLFDPDWEVKRAAGGRKRKEDPLWRANQRQGAKEAAGNVEAAAKRSATRQRNAAEDPNYYDNVRKANAKTATDPEWRRKVKEANAKHADDPEWKEKQQAGVDKKRQDVEWAQNIASAAKERFMDPDWAAKRNEAVQQGCIDSWKDNDERRRNQSLRAKQAWANEENKKARAKKRMKPLVTPKGVFESSSAAASFYGITPGTMSHHIKTKPADFYYITKEEYEQLTSNNQG